MSRSTEPRRARRRALAATVSLLLGLAGSVVATTPASAATWTISGEIGNWDATLDGTDVYVVLDDGSFGGVDVGEFQISGPSFTWDSADAYDPAAAVDGRYTLYFDVDPTVEFIDGYLGGKLVDEYSDATWLDADPVADVDAGTIDLLEASYISGTVTGGGASLSGADVFADDAGYFDLWGWMPTPFQTQTDALGEYSLKVAAGRTYVVSVENPGWPGQIYRGWDACGCDYDPVPGPLKPSLPATGVDFDLAVPEILLAGAVVTGDLLGTYVGFEDVEVHVYRPVVGGWRQVAVSTTDVDGEWQQYLAEPGSVRLRFSWEGSWLKVDEIYGGIAPHYEHVSDVGACYVDTGDIPTASFYIAATAVLDPALDATCGPEPAPSTPGGSTPPRPRPATATSVVPTPVPTATPTASPTATHAPRPTATPTPSASPEAQPASAPDLWWVLWVLLAVVVVAIVGGVIWFARRR